MDVDRVSFRFEKDYSGRDIIFVSNFNNRHDFTYNINGNKIELEGAGQTMAGSGLYGVEERMMHDAFLKIKNWKI